GGVPVRAEIAGINPRIHRLLVGRGKIPLGRIAREGILGERNIPGPILGAPASVPNRVAPAVTGPDRIPAGRADRDRSRPVGHDAVLGRRGVSLPAVEPFRNAPGAIEAQEVLPAGGLERRPPY